MKRNDPKLSPLDRRGFLEGLAAGAGGVALAGCGGGDDPPRPAFEPPLPPSTTAERSALPRLPLPAPGASGIDHIVLVTMENRSFDHFLGWVPRSEGLQAGLRFSDAFGDIHPTFALAPDADYGFESCGWADPNHSYEAGRTNLGGEKMNGWLLTADTNQKRGDRLPIGYYRAEDLPFFQAVAAEYSICDYYFSGILSETYPNRLYLHSGQTDRLGNSLVTSTLPTIWDRLAAKSISRKYYYSDVAFTALYGTRYNDISTKIDTFFADAAAGALPAFSMVDPRFGFTQGGATAGSSNDDHPHADVRNGQAFLSQVCDALRKGPNWSKTLLIITYDEWGGFYDHVVPPVRPVPAEEKALGNDGRLGFRVPLLLIGPRVPRGQVSRHPFDPSSIHQLLEWRFGLEPLSLRSREAATVNLAQALDLVTPPGERAALPVLAERAAECPSTVLPARIEPADRKSAQASPSTAEDPGLRGGRFHDLWLKSQANGFPP